MNTSIILAIIILCTISLIGYGVFTIGGIINTHRFYQVVPERRVLFPALIGAFVCQFAAIVLAIMEVF